MAGVNEVSLEKHDGCEVLVCKTCPPKWSMRTGEPDWNKCCDDTEAVILERQDAGMLEEWGTYLIPISPEGSVMCRDPWALWIKVAIGESNGGIAKVTFEYESEFYQKTSGILGYITLADDGRQTIRDMMWDWLTAALLDRQPKADQGAFVCPQRNHSKNDSRDGFRQDVLSQDTLNAQVACVVLESCCTYCYEAVMGESDDDDFGMNGVTNKPKPVQQVVQGRNLRVAPVVNVSSSTSASGGIVQRVTHTVNTSAPRDPNAARPPWEQ